MCAHVHIHGGGGHWSGCGRSPVQCAQIPGRVSEWDEHVQWGGFEVMYIGEAVFKVIVDL